MAERLRQQTLATLTLADGSNHQVVQTRLAGRTYGRGGGFVIVFTEAMARAGERIKQGGTLRVLALLPEYLDFVNFRRLSTAQVGKRLDMHTGNVSRAMAQLLELGIVEREGSGPVTTWRLSSDWGWNGTVDQYHAFRGGRLKGKKAPVRPVEAPSPIMHTPAAGVAAGGSENKRQSRLTLLQNIKGGPA